MIGQPISLIVKHNGIYTYLTKSELVLIDNLIKKSMISLVALMRQCIFFQFLLQGTITGSENYI